MFCFWGSLRALILWYLLCSLAEVSSALQCETKSIFGTVLNCADDSDSPFCCERDSGIVYCCDLDDYVKLNSWKFVVYIGIGIVIVIVIGCVACCCCCPCCMLYKRRHRGTVYGRVQQPSTVLTVQTNSPAPPIVPAQGNVHMPNTMPMPMPMPMAQAGAVPMQAHVAPYPAYPGPTGDLSGQHSMPPPPYSAVTNEGYAKQAPYNPSFYNN
ncbi:Uncharacterized protein GBIM_03895 [Gryllus bimaculatus]|nr:Uncharacterized protein GBIM_03895 [Gryllus bimaculatus]